MTVLYPYAWLILGVFLSSTSFIFARLAEVHPLVISFYRVFSAGLIWLGISLFIVRKKRRYSLKKTDRMMPKLILSGLSLALYYGFWISSLQYTTVAKASLLGALCPIFVAFLAWRILGEKLNKKALVGITICIVGSVVMMTGGVSDGPSHLRGDLLALVGAVSISGYYMIGGWARKRISLDSYVSIVYLSAAAVLLVMLIVFRIPLTGYTSLQYMILVSHGIVCSVMGHGIYNGMMGKLSATHLSLASLGEPVFATAMALLFFREVPSLFALSGMAIVLVGLYMFFTKDRLQNTIIMEVKNE